MVRRKSRAPRRRCRRLAASAGQPPGERLDHAAHGDDLLARGVQEVDVLGQRAAQGAGHGRGAAVVHQAAAHLGLHGLAESLQLGLVLLDLQPAEQAGLFTGLLWVVDQTGEQPVGIHGAQRAEHVVGARDRAAGLDRGVPVHEHAGNGAQHDLVPVAQGVEQQFGQGRVVERSHRAAAPAPGSGLAFACAGLGGLPRFRVGFCVGGVGRQGAGRRGEVEVEEGVEGELVIVVLDQRRAQGGLDAVALGERQVVQAPDRIDLLGHRDRDADLAQLGDHAFEGGKHG